MSSILGQIFRISTWGESHGGGVGVMIDGCPPNVALCEELIQAELDRRKPGQSDIVTPRKEQDRCEILSGVFEGKTLGSPIAILVRNKDARPSSYNEMQYNYRPSHADYTYDAKYGIRNWQGGGRSSARETIGRVAAGAVAKAVMNTLHPGIETIAWVKSIKHLVANTDYASITQEKVESNIVRTSDAAIADEMIAFIKATRSNGDSVGGVVECVIRGCPPGLGSPVFDKLEADLAKGMMSLPATKGFEVGSGFECTQYYGSEHNDPFYIDEGVIRTKTNHSGGIQGGISNGENIVFRVAFKPTATIMTEQDTVNSQTKSNSKLVGRGRHDACVLPRAVPMVEAMTNIIICDQLLRQKIQS